MHPFMYMSIRNRILFAPDDGGAGGGQQTQQANDGQQQTQQTQQAWYDGFTNNDIKGWIANKQYASPEVQVEAHYNLEKLLGHHKAGRTVVVPDDSATPEERAAFYTKLGRPDTADKYEIPAVEGADPNFSKGVREMLFEAGVPAAQGKALAEKYIALEKQVADARAAEQTARFTQEGDKLKKEWGAAYEDKAKGVDRAASEFGLNEQELVALRNALGPYRAMTFLDAVGSKLGEGSYISGDSSRDFSGAMTPAQAQSRIKDLRGDSDFIKRYTSGDVNAKAEMDRLHKYAYPA